MRLMIPTAVFSISLTISMLAQTKSTAPPSNQPIHTAAEEAMSPTETPEQPEETPSSLEPVLWVTSVEAMSSTHEPKLDVIRVRGLTSTEGWQSAELVPIGKGTSPDGMLDLVLVAQPPSDSATTKGFPVIEAVFTIEPGHPYKGVRVHSATNRITVKALPGYGEAPPPPDDCSKCVGKYFVGKGETLPAGVNETDSIREESLPKMLHVIKSADGVGKLDSEPNRLTLIIDEDGRIVIAVWD